MYSLLFGVANAWTSPQLTSQDHNSCPADSPASCSGNGQDSCCYEATNGVFLSTQFWDYDPATGPSDAFTLHGLWSDKCSGGYNQFCNKDWEISGVANILSNLGKDDLLSNLKKYWKNNGDSDSELWEHEFNKHATCMYTLNPDCYGDNAQQYEYVGDFYTTAFELYESLPTYKWLTDAGIQPDNDQTYNVDDITSVLSQNFGGKDVFIGCDHSNNLQQVWYFYSLQGSVASGKFSPADSISRNTCKDGLRWIPKDGGDNYRRDLEKRLWPDEDPNPDSPGPTFTDDGETVPTIAGGLWGVKRDVPRNSDGLPSGWNTLPWNDDGPLDKRDLPRNSDGVPSGYVIPPWNDDGPLPTPTFTLSDDDDDVAAPTHVKRLWPDDGPLPTPTVTLSDDADDVPRNSDGLPSGWNTLPWNDDGPLDKRDLPRNSDGVPSGYVIPPWNDDGPLPTPTITLSDDADDVAAPTHVKRLWPDEDPNPDSPGPTFTDDGETVPTIAGGLWGVKRDVPRNSDGLPSGWNTLPWNDDGPLDKRAVPTHVKRLWPDEDPNPDSPGPTFTDDGETVPTIAGGLWGVKRDVPRNSDGLPSGWNTLPWNDDGPLPTPPVITGDSDEKRDLPRRRGVVTTSEDP